MNSVILITAVILANEFVATLTSRSYRGYSTKIDFPSVVNKTEFVDKTLLTKIILDDQSKQIVITTPHRCGKSTNIAMLKMFFEIQLNDGEPITKSKGLRSAVSDTSNYEFFVNNNLKITRNKKIMKDYFGKFPVLHVDFKCKYKIKDSENAVNCFREVIHEAFFEHRYLRQSEYLSTKERRYVKKWCDNFGDYEDFYGQDVTNSLYKLAIILHKHYEREVVVLIDNYDFPTTSAIPEVKDAEELIRVLKFNMGIISKLLSADYKYLERAVIVGVSYVATTGLYELEGAQYFRFLEDHPFVKYFSLTKTEVERLFKNPYFNLDETAILAAQGFYGGLWSQSGQTVYSLHSVLKFLQFRKAETYCLQSRTVRNLGNVLKLPFIKKNIESLVKGEHLAISMYDNITAYDIINLSKAISNEKFDDHFNTNLLFYFLFEQGYLTYVSSNISLPNQAQVKIPNRETRTRVSLKLKDYYDKFYVLDKTLLRKCVSFFNEISPSITVNKSRFKMGLYWFYKSFEDLIRLACQRFKKLNLEDIKKIVFSYIFETVVKDNSEFYIDYCEENGAMDFFMVRGKFKYHIEFIANGTSTFVLHHLLKDKYIHIGNDNNQTTDLKKYIFIGMGVNDEFQPSISCLASSINITDAVHIP